MNGRNPHQGTDPHANAPIETRGPSLAAAKVAMVIAHGRGATANGIITLSGDLDIPGVTYLAPQAAGRTWYPHSFTAPVNENEPSFSSGLALVDSLVDRVLETELTPANLVLCGFSQGACLIGEYAARNTRDYGGIALLSGGLVGPDGTEFVYEGSLKNVPVFIGCSDDDPHIPLKRVEETAMVFEALGAAVDKRIYSGMGHGINEDELTALKSLVSAATTS